MIVGSTKKDLMDGKHDQGSASQAFDRAGDRFEQARSTFDKPHQAFAQDDRQNCYGRNKVSATPTIMVPANRMPAAGTPRAIAKLMTNSVRGQGTSPAMTPTASPSCL